MLHMDTIPVFPRTPSSDPSRPHRKLQVAPPLDPSQWGKEVIGALSTRIPGGRSAITTPCNTCSSVFNPCLCKKVGRHRCGVETPLVVRAAEERRINKSPLMQTGYLDTVLSTSQVIGADNDRLLVMGPHDPKYGTLNDLMHFVREDSKISDVLRREGANYVINSQVVVPTQPLELKKDELQKLAAVLREQTHMGHSHGLFIKPHSIGEAVRTVSVDYTRLEDAFPHVDQLPECDLTLLSCPFGWEVTHVRARGLACKNGIRIGNQLVEIRKLIASGHWDNVNMDVQLPLCLGGTEKHSNEDDFFPCRLIFDVLPFGAHLQTVLFKGSEGPCTWELLQTTIQDCKQNETATVTFDQKRQITIVSSDQLVAHSHAWEFKHDVKNDQKLLIQWQELAQTMTPTQIVFVYKKILEMARTKLTNVEAANSKYKSLVLGKVLRCYRLTYNFQSPEKELSVEKRQELLTHSHAELTGVFNSLPSRFLDDVVSASSRSAADDARYTTKVWMGHANGRGAQRQSIDISSHPADYDSTGALTAHSSMEALEADPNLWRFLLNAVKKHQEGLKQGKGVGDRRETDISAADAMDSRISYKDFQRFLHQQGVTIPPQSMQKWFNNMDDNKSGLLNIGEIGGTATRTMQLLRRAEAYGAAMQASGKTLSQKEQVDMLVELLQKGEDLVGHRHRTPIVEDSCISASSHFFPKEEMWRSRLYSETAWVGTEKDSKENAWLRWDFKSSKTITMVISQGCSTFESYVKKFRLKYLPADRAPGSKEQWQDCTQEFTGNSDRNTEKVNKLKEPITEVIAVMLCPTDWTGTSPAIRATCYGFDAQLLATHS